MRNRENIGQEDRLKLTELLAANRGLATVQGLKDDRKHRWDYSYQGAARRFWNEWHDRAVRSGIEPLKQFARNPKEKLGGVWVHGRRPRHTSRLEGINNKIKVIKRAAYGFRDDDDFCLKIRQAFPGIP